MDIRRFFKPQPGGWTDVVLWVSAAGLVTVLLIFFSAFPYFEFFYSNLGSPNWIVQYYQVATPLLLLVFPLSTGVFLNARNKLNWKITIGLIILFSLAFAFMVPLVSRSYYDVSCQTNSTESLSLSRLLTGIGFKSTSPSCLTY